MLLLPPTRRDGTVTAGLLADADIACLICDDGEALAAAMEDGAGALMLTDSALADPSIERVVASLAQQPAWSDLPIVLLLSRDGAQAPAVTRLLGRLTNVTLLDRPTSTRSMVSAVHAALRARLRQYEMRDQLAALRSAQDALRIEHRRKDEFLATLAHELRNPLAPIRTGLQLLAHGAVDAEEATPIRAMMDRQLGMLIRLIDDLLDLSRISSGKIVLRREHIDLRTVVHSALEGCKPLIEASGHTLRVDLPAAPLRVFADAPRLSQVVGNLVTNAAKYTPPGGRIDVSMWTEGGHAVISVADNGAGIPAEMLGRVFDMFAQVDETLERSQGGLGIGLSLVRRLMHMHGGSVVADSPGLGQGSTFTLRLPMHGAPERDGLRLADDRDRGPTRRTRAGDGDRQDRRGGEHPGVFGSGFGQRAARQPIHGARDRVHERENGVDSDGPARDDPTDRTGGAP